MELNDVSDVWEEVDLSELYLSRGMFEEAASLASSIIRQISHITNTEAMDSMYLADLMESAGMVFVQSFMEMRRTRELLIELELLFGSLVAIPVDVFLVGACALIFEGFSSDILPIFTKYIGLWKYSGNEVYDIPEVAGKQGFIVQTSMAGEKYLELAETYAIGLLGVALANFDLAISWIEKAELPDEKRQEMLKRLHSMRVVKISGISLTSGKLRTNEACNGTGDVCALSEVECTQKVSNADAAIGAHKWTGGISKPRRSSIGSLLQLANFYFQWFCGIRVKFGNFHLAAPYGKLALVCSMMAFALYILRRRGTSLKKIVGERASSIKGALVDAWQLAFSVQINPLAAVQQLPSTARSSR